jgi:hypothetical protein
LHIFRGYMRVSYRAVYVKSYVLKVSTIGEVILEPVTNSNHCECPHQWARQSHAGHERNSALVAGAEDLREGGRMIVSDIWAGGTRTARIFDCVYLSGQRPRRLKPTKARRIHQLGGQGVARNI